MEHTPNEITLQVYARNFEAYQKNTPPTMALMHPNMVAWIDSALDSIPQAGRILEIGSAINRDAKYLREKGFEVVCSDAVPAFVQSLRHQGERAMALNIIKEQPADTYDMVFANAVVPHFTTEDFNVALLRIRKCLVCDGIFAFSVKEGTGDGWVNEKFVEKRYTRYWELGELRNRLSIAGFKVIFSNRNRGHLPSHKWLNIVAQKVEK